MAWNQGVRVKAQLVFQACVRSDLTEFGTAFIPIGHTDTKAEGKVTCPWPHRWEPGAEGRDEF